MSESLDRAEVHLVSALELLDGAAAPAEIGAYVDMALHHLRNFQAKSADHLGPSQSSNPCRDNPER
jgi:hypothetical protein